MLSQQHEWHKRSTDAPEVVISGRSTGDSRRHGDRGAVSATWRVAVVERRRAGRGTVVVVAGIGGPRRAARRPRQHLVEAGDEVVERPRYDHVVVEVRVEGDQYHGVAHACSAQRNAIRKTRTCTAAHVEATLKQRIVFQLENNLAADVT